MPHNGLVYETEVGITGEILSDGLFFDPFEDEPDDMMWDVSEYGNKPNDFDKVGLPSHYWFYYNGKHYDSDAPQGVTDFVKDIMNKLGDNDYCYLHNCDPSILKDISNLKHNNSFISFDNWNLISDYPIKHNSQIIRTESDIFINTWIGQKDMSYIHTDKDISCSLYAQSIGLLKVRIIDIFYGLSKLSTLK